jgi:hypothetical protein
MTKTKTATCNYQGHEFGASYPDSVCVDGRLFDADNCDGRGNLYEPTEHIPCPKCRREDAVRHLMGQLDDSMPYTDRRRRARLAIRGRLARFAKLDSQEKRKE